MGASNCPETPRQKMIGMMYLVLTALLALNVSKDILDAFLVVNDGMVITNEAMDAKVEGNYAEFAAQNALDPQKTKKYWDKAQEVQKLSNELVTYIADLKWELISKTEGISIEEAKGISLREVKKKDNYDTPTNFFVGSSHDGKEGKGLELRTKIEEYRAKLLAFVDEGDREDMSKKLGLITDDINNDIQGKMNWQMANFYHTILVADVVIMNKLMAEVRSAESDIVGWLYGNITAEDFKFDKVEAKVVPQSSYVLVGDEYKAQIFVAAYNSTSNPEIKIITGADTITGATNLEGASSLAAEDFKNGVGWYSVPASSTGLQKYAGVIQVKDPKSGLTKDYPFSHEYMVAKPAATIAADNMNVFYIGLDNPVSVSVPGVPAEDLSVSMSNGSISKKGNGQYTVRVKQRGKAQVRVSANVGGSSRSMGAREFRVKKVPDPTPYVSNSKGGVISKSKLKGYPVVEARLEDFLFDGVRYTVTGFLFQTLSGGYLVESRCSGGRFNSKALSYVNKARSGQKIFIEDIRAKGPDGSTRKLSSVILKVQ